MQLSSDAFEPYLNAVDAAFGRQVDYAQIVKSYEETPAGRGRYSPPRIVSVDKDEKIGFPDMDLVSTSLSIRCTPAMETGVASSPMTVKELVEMAA